MFSGVSSAAPNFSAYSSTEHFPRLSPLAAALPTIPKTKSSPVKVEAIINLFFMFFPFGFGLFMGATR